MNELMITYYSDDEVKTKSLMDTSLMDILNKPGIKTTTIGMDVLKHNMVETLDNVMKIFEDERLENREFAIEEIEVALNIGCEGSISILSAVSGQANMQSSVVVKLKRR